MSANPQSAPVPRTLLHLQARLSPLSSALNQLLAIVSHPNTQPSSAQLASQLSILAPLLLSLANTIPALKNQPTVTFPTPDFDPVKNEMLLYKLQPKKVFDSAKEWEKEGQKEAEGIVGGSEREAREEEEGVWASELWDLKVKEFEDMMEGVEEEIAALQERLPKGGTGGKENMLARWKFEATGGR